MFAYITSFLDIMSSMNIDAEWQAFLQLQKPSAHSLIDINSLPTDTNMNMDSYCKQCSNEPSTCSETTFEKCEYDDDTEDDYDDDDESEEDDDDDDNDDEADSDEQRTYNEYHNQRRNETLKSSVANPVETKAPYSQTRNECEDLYISTQTQIFFLNTNELDVDNMFWTIPILDYSTPGMGVIKKQMRVIAKDKEEFEQYQERLKTYTYFTEKIMKQIDNPKARKIKYKDVRKLTIGVSKKDIMNCHGKNKNAFINCFAMILRVKYQNMYHEIHVKVFNTGKLAIPGIVDDGLLEETKILLLQTLQPSFTLKNIQLKLISASESPLVKRLVRAKKKPNKSSSGTSNNTLASDGSAQPNVSSTANSKSYFEYVQPKENVLINSNFNCGYYIQQEKLKHVLQNKYKLNTAYDPSMYPGVKCKFFYKNDLPEDPMIQDGVISESDRNVTMMELDELSKEKYTRVSFMIFRTGNCLIVGNCTKPILQFVFEFVKKILMDEYDHIKAIHDIPVVKMKKKKPRKKIVYLERAYYQNHMSNSTI